MLSNAEIYKCLTIACSIIKRSKSSENNLTLSYQGEHMHTVKLSNLLLGSMYVDKYTCDQETCLRLSMVA